ncbi:hypothetical protein predicted by Glimmer/Critica [Acetobacter senegalensis]|uniref:Uncharacterized protein n=2 Tax=Acetobacter TaxID=434 RepID=A0A0U5EUT9_9PROT|nr:hypothetical protein ATPR_2496 [Acetobacter tropicalis NBRC 101654]CEF40640.1 hypothetical protein predicted by Glimmer/Critica [Acetobacter senegalensis]
MEPFAFGATAREHTPCEADFTLQNRMMGCVFAFSVLFFLVESGRMAVKAAV